MGNSKDKIQTTIVMNPRLWKRVKITALEQDKDASTLVTEMIEEWFEKKKIKNI